MRLRSYSLRVRGAARHAEEFQNPREVARRLGGLYATVRSDVEDLLVTVAVEVPAESLHEGATVDALRLAGEHLFPADLYGRFLLREEPNGPHAITAQLFEDKRRGTPALAGALQAHEDLQAWEDFLTRVQPRGLIELGAATGAFSRWLNERVEWFRTIDIVTPEPEPPGFIRLDLWKRAGDVQELIEQAPRPFVLYCDDGDKPLEVETFGPALQVGDYLAVHDYGTEISERDMPPEFSAEHTFGLTSFYKKERATIRPRFWAPRRPVRHVPRRNALRLPRSARVVTLPLLGVAAFAAAALLGELLTDRDWTLSGLEWPEDFLTAVVLACIVPLIFHGIRWLAPTLRKSIGIKHVESEHKP